VNGTGKEGFSRAETVPVVIIGSNGMLYGPFADGAEANAWASRKWPDQQQIGDADDGWDITALWPPD
jgi:hypothetical protein